jgi:hypothetical protein
MEQTAPWKIATGLLALAVVVMGVLMWQEARQNDLGTALEEGQAELADVRAEVASACEGPGRDEAECQRALSELSSVLVEFSASVAETDRGGAVEADGTMTAP